MAFFGLFGGKQNPDSIAMGGPGALATFPEMKQPKQNDGQLHINPKLAALSQIFASLSGRQSPVLGLLLQQQAEQRRQQQLEQARQAGMQDWQTKQEWLQAHPSPAAPGMFERTLQGAGIDPNSPEGRSYFRKRADLLTTPMQLVGDPLTGYTRVPIYGGGMGGGLPPGYDPSQWEVDPNQD